MSKEKMSRREAEQSDECIYRIPPYYYLHVQDQTTNVTRVEVGPQTFIRHDNERVVLGLQKFVIVPPNHYCAVKNPVIRAEDGSLVCDVAKQVKLRHGDLEIRLEQDPFPLYPGEEIVQDVTRLKVVPVNAALRLQALWEFIDGEVKRVAGDEWLFEGPGVYIPRKEVKVLGEEKAIIIKANQALKLRAKQETKDKDGIVRVAGEEWLVRKTGAYLSGAHEEVVDVCNAYVLTDKIAIHVKALRSFVDQFNKPRKNGEEWLVTMDDTETYIPGVYEEVVSKVQITTLNNRQYCTVLDPVGADGKPQLGKRKLIKGEQSFFLQPGEVLQAGISDVYVLCDTNGLILRAREAFLDDNEDPPVMRKPGDRWMIKGPKEYIPPVEVEVVNQRSAIPLHENEGIYVRNIKTGKVRSVCGQTYMLNQDEELWEKELPTMVEDLLFKNKDPLADRGDYAKEMRAFGSVAMPKMAIIGRDKTRVVSFKVPHNAAVQIYDYREKKARVVFGPDLVMLGPDESFTQLSLSGGRPKRPNIIKTICLLLGPDFCTDLINVETGDHARLQLQLSYNWHFNVTDKSPEAAARVFSVPDFVGDLCKAIASRIRGAVAGVYFDDFHKNSSRIIQAAVFGYDENKKLKNSLPFPQNNVIVTSIDIQGVEPVDQRTRDSLQKSVQLAIEITTQSQEAAARHEADRREQEAKGRLERQRISDEVEAERTKKDLLELQADSLAVETCGQAKADAIGRAEALKIEGESEVHKAKLQAEAMTISAEAELDRLRKARQAEIQFLEESARVEVSKATEMAEVEVKKFKNMVDALGQETIKAIALAGPELQVKLLQGLNMSSALITDGSCPINLFTTAQGLINPAILPSPAQKRKADTDVSGDKLL